MKTTFYNIGYFFMEAMRTIRFNPLSNLFSVIGTGLILFLLGMVLAGGSIGDRIIKTLEQEAEISAYFTDGADQEKALALSETIQAMDGVLEANYIDETEAHNQMEKMLGEEAGILELFEENPFEAFLEIRIDLEKMDSVVSEVSQLEGIEYVRDNRAVLEQMKQITDGLKLVGLLVSLAVSVTTLIIISHMIRQGIYNNREQINTLRLLGAPGGFIGFPFLLAGTILTLIGGAIAILFIFVVVNGGYDQLGGSIPFLPLPDKETLLGEVCLILLGISVVLGVLGSVFGLSSIKKVNGK